MKKLVTLLIGMLALTSLTACSFGNDNKPNDGGNNQQDGDSNNPSYDGESQGGGSGGGSQGGDTVATNTVSITTENLAYGYGWVEDNTTQYLSFNLDTAISVTTQGSQNSGRYYEATNSNDANYRIYKSDSGKITFKAPAGETIRGIKLTFTVKNSGAFEGGLSSGVEKAFNANSVTLTVSKGTICITEFEVKYTGEKGEDPFYREDWTDEELALIDKYAYGVEIPFMYIPGNSLSLYQESAEDEGFLSLYGATCTLAELQEYSALFRAAEGWEELSDEEDINDFMFEKKVMVEGEERLITAELYLVDDYGYFIEDEDEEGEFNIDFVDPYYYEWPTEGLAYLGEEFGSEATIPAIDNVTRIYVDQSDEYQFVLASYNHTEAQFNAYIEKLGETFVVEDGSDDLEGFKIAYPKGEGKDDIELWVGFFEDEGAIVMYINKRLPHLSAFPQTEVKSRNGGNDIPVPEGASYFTYEEEFETYYDYDIDDNVEEFSQAVVTAYDIDATELEAYVTTGFNLGNWEVTLIGVDDENNPSLKAYIAQLFKNDETYYEFVMVYDIENEALEMTIYLLEGYKFSTSYPEAAINKFLTDNSLGTIPSLALSGITHYIYVENENYVWVFAQGDFEEAWLDILDDAGYTIPETPTDYGYECRDANNTVEIDVLYDENYGQTGFTIYSTDYIDSLSDWGDIDWDSLFDD